MEETALATFGSPMKAGPPIPRHCHHQEEERPSVDALSDVLNASAALIRGIKGPLMLPAPRNASVAASCLPAGGPTPRSVGTAGAQTIPSVARPVAHDAK